MSKERLEEIEHFVDLIDFIPRDNRGMGEMDVINIKKDMEWLIGRVQELEEWQEKAQQLHESLKRQDEVLDRLRQQNKRYRDLLERIDYLLEKTGETDGDIYGLVRHVRTLIDLEGMSKEYRIYDDRTNETLFEGSHIECMSILSQIDEEDEIFPHVWIEELEESE